MTAHANRIPIKAGRAIADAYGYDQVVIIARKVDTPEKKGGEHVTTYGVNKTHCDVAARIGNFLKHEIMRWPRPAPKARRCRRRARAPRDRRNMAAEVRPPLAAPAGRSRSLAARDRGAGGRSPGLTHPCERAERAPSRAKADQGS